MFILVSYTLVVFILSFISLKFLRRRLWSPLIVVAWTLFAPVVMQVANYFLVGYLDPFWVIAAVIQGAIALVASIAAVAIWAEIDRRA